MPPLSPSQAHPWWKEPMVWMIIVLPLVAVLASFVSYYFAARDPDPMVKEAYRKVGMAPLAPASGASQAAAALGLAAQVRVSSGQLQLDLRGRLASAPQQLALDILHPTSDKQDRHILLALSHGQTYTGPAPELDAGKRILVLQPADQAWRISGQWNAPFSGMTELVAGPSHSATHP